MTSPTLLVTTSTAVLLVERDRPRPIHTGRGIYFGLTWDHDFVYVLCRNNLGHGRLRRLFGYTVTMEVLDKSFRQVDSIRCPSIHDPHQAIARDGHRSRVTVPYMLPTPVRTGSRSTATARSPASTGPASGRTSTTSTRSGSMIRRSTSWRTTSRSRRPPRYSTSIGSRDTTSRWVSARTTSSARDRRCASAAR